MKRATTIAVLMLAPLFQASGKTDQNLKHEQEIRTLLDEFAQAFAKIDTAVLQRLVADDYVHTNLDGSVLNKTQWLARAQARQAEIISGTFRIDHYRYDDLRIRIYGNTAVVTGVAITNGHQEGKAFNWNLRFTNVWVKRDGRWQRVAFHDSAGK